LAGSDAAAFEIDAASGEVTLTANPDFEAQEQYSFTVIASDDVNATAQQAVSLEIIDVDNTAPVITSLADAGSVVENSGAGQVVYTAVATDETSAEVTFTLSGADAAAFGVDASGAVTLNENPDYEAKSSYAFTVIATDSAGNFSEKAVTLSVIDVTGEFPVFNQTPNPILNENTPFAYTATATVDSGATLTYSLADDFGGVFSIDSTTGVVSMSETPDFEEGINYSFTVMATDNVGNSTTKTVSLMINNLDDSAPTFAENSVEVALTENTGENQVIFIANADDSSDVSAGVSYSFYDSTASYNGPVVVEDVQYLYVSQATLTESDTKLTATISYDSFDPETSGLGLRVHYDSAALTLNTISDALSADLIFTNGQPTLDAEDFDANANTDTYVDAGWASLYGNWPNDTLPSDVLMLTFDINSSAAATTEVGLSSLASPVGFSFDGPTATVSLTSNVGNTLGSFSIDGSTGAVTLSENPDQETTPEYNFSVLATDVAGNQSNPQLVTVTVNDQPLSIASSNVAVAIDENIGAGQAVYNTAVSGAEVGDQISYSLLTAVVQQSGGIEQRFVDNQDGSITLQLYVSPSVLGDYPNSIENYDLVINYNNDQITGSNLSLHPELRMNIVEETVPGEIKVAGVFLSNLPDIVNDPLLELNFELQENIAFAEFTVFDALLGTDHTVLHQSVSRYYDSRGFSIDEATGVVSLIENPDHEIQTDYIFTVMAEDTVTGQSDTRSVVLAVNDLDDAQPIVTSDNVADAVDENTGAGQIVYTATADDSGDVSDGLSFSLAEGSDAALSIDAATGDVSLIVDPDYEAQSQYSFAVIATDAAGNGSDAQAVTLSINNVDDAAPTITSGNSADSVDENAASGQVIYTATADDSGDIVADGPITFSLSSDSDAEFSIDAATGAVSFNATADHENDSEYSFNVVVTDAAGNVSQAQTVTMGINDLDDSVPIITSGDTAAGIDENTGAGQVIYIATAEDSADVSDGFSFSLADGSDAALSIDPDTGEVILTTDPDFETQSQFNFSVIAADAAGNTSEPQAVVLEINNLDEVAPTITSAETVEAILENSGAGQVIYTATADDSADASVGFTFSLAEGSDEALAIDAYTGKVSLALDPDYELQNQFNFAVVATDAAGNWSESGELSLDILDEDDFSLAGQVYHWQTQSLLENVTVSMHDSNANHLIESVNTSTNGNYLIDDLASGQVTVKVERDLQDEDQGRFVTSLDALAALKMSVGINPNSMDNTGDYQLEISPYQFVAADVNKSGSVTSLDALEILRMAVRMPGAFDREWLFFDESEDYWSENDSDQQAALGVDKDNIPELPDSFNVKVEQAETANFVGVMLGDVYSSWRAPTDSQYMPAEHFIELEDNGVAPLYQWGMSPQAFVFKSSDTAEDLLEMSGAGLVVYTIKATDMETTYSLGDSLDSTSFEVNAETGEVVLSSDPDFDLQSSYSFEVIATSSKGISISQIVSLAIAERDPSVPFFESADTAPVIDENSGEEQIVYTAVAANIDTGIDAGAITYSLSANNNGVFSIDAESGAVTLAVNPDFEQADSYGFTVVATNAEGNSAELAVTLSVNNMDEAVPIVTSSSTASVNENIGGNQIVYQAEADDAADISNGVSYSLVDNSLAVSEINLPELVADTQHVYVSESTKSEDGSQETIVISYDADNAAATGLGLQIHFNSSVLGVDSLFEVFAEDNIFAFETPIEDTDNVDNDANTDMYLSLGWASLHGTWPGSVPTELASVVFDILDTSSTVSTVNLVSSGNSAGYHFDGQSHDIVLEAGVSVLSIDATSGEVTLLEDPDFEIQSEYSFDVIATDMAGNASTAKVVTLAVNDIDETPRIISDEMAVVLEGNGSDQVVYTATTNIEGATFSLLENTIYPEIDSTSEPLETVISVPVLVADTQHVYVSESTKSADGSQITVKLSYLVDNPSLTGVGFSLGFDSSVLSLSGVSNVLNGAIASGHLASSGESLTFGWASLFGGWPGSTNSELATITFDILEGATGTTALNIEKTSGTPGYEFDGQAQNLVISAEAQTEPMAPQLSIDSNTGVVTLEGDADYELVPNYSFTVTADNGTISASQGVGLVVADTLVASDSYDGTENADVIALGLGSAEVTSGNGEDVYVIAQTLNQWSTSAFTLTDFDSSADTIDVSAALLAAGYTGISPAEGLEENQLNLMTNVSSDVLDLISSDDSSLDNAIGSYFDDATNVLTIFADSDSSAGSSAIESIEISIGDGSTVEEDGLTLAAFIA
jgi:hypothetical protein